MDCPACASIALSQPGRVLLQLPGLPAPTAEAGVPVWAKEQDAASWAVGEGGEGLEEVWGRAYLGGFGLPPSSSPWRRRRAERRQEIVERP